MIKELVEKHGAKNVYFFVRMSPVRRALFGLISYSSSSDKMLPVLCEIKEDRYKIADNYKIELVSVGEWQEIFGGRSFYISDLETIIMEGHCEVLVKKCDSDSSIKEQLDNMRSTDEWMESLNGPMGSR